MDQWATNNKLIWKRVKETEKKVAAKEDEEELKANEIELVARVENLEKVRA